MLHRNDLGIEYVYPLLDRRFANQLRSVTKSKYDIVCKKCQKAFEILAVDVVKHLFQCVAHRVVLVCCCCFLESTLFSAHRYGNTAKTPKPVAL
ncbi:hypothetical protein D3C86_2056640 [compost metagenome]